MFSRVNVLQATGDQIDVVAQVARELIYPGIREQPGFRGYIALGDRESGRAIGVTLWASEEAMRDSEKRAGQIRPQVEERTGGTMKSIEEYEVLVYEVESSAS